MQRMALYLQDKHPMAYELEVAEYAEADRKSTRLNSSH